MSESTQYPVEHLSYSSVSRYLMCARSWKYHYVDRIETPTAAALAFGSAFHETVEYYLTARALGGEFKEDDGDDDPLERGALPTLWLEQFKAQVEREGEIDWGGKSVHELSNLGLRILGNSTIQAEIDKINPKVDDGHPVIEKQVELRVPGVPVPITGYIDVIEEDGVPGDIKTSGRSWNVSRALSETQPLFYLAALQQEGYSNGLRFRHYVFTKTKRPRCNVIQTEREQGEIFWLLSAIREVWDVIEAGHYPPNPHTWKCQPRYCEFFDLCWGGAKGEK